MKKVLYLPLIIVLLFIGYLSVLSEPYHYPITPGSITWDTTESYADRVQLCNIPDSILTSMSTHDLLISIFNFPYSQNLILNDNFFSSFDYTKSLFNGLDEISERNNSDSVLYDKYIYKTNEINFAREILLEEFMSLSFVLNNLDTNKKMILLDTCLNRISLRLETDNFLLDKSLISSSLMMIRILSYIDNEYYTTLINSNQAIKEFAETSEYPDKSTINNIISIIIEYRNGS